MVRGYKLRLGDGTTFAVDEKGLLTWLNGGLVDEKTRVQAGGSTQWLSIRQMIAAERAAAERLVEKRIAAQHEAAAEVAAAERNVAEERAAEQRQAAAARAEADQRVETDEGIALARQAHEERVASEREAARARAEVERGAAAERVAAEERAAAERQAAEARRAETERRAAEERAEAERRAADERAEAERLAAAERAAAERRAAKAKAQTDLRAEMARQAEKERRAAEERAATEARAAAEREAAERRAEEARAAAERRAAEERAEAERRAAVARKAEEDRRAAEERAEAERRAAAQRAEEERRAAAERAEAEARAAAEEAARARAAEERAAAELRAAMASQAEKERRAAEERRAAYATRDAVHLQPLATDLELELLDDDEPAPRRMAQAPSLRIALRPLDDEPRPATVYQGGDPVAPVPEATPVEKFEAGVVEMFETLRPVMEPIDDQVSAWTRWRRRRAVRYAGRPTPAARLARTTKPAIVAFEGGVRFLLALVPPLRSRIGSVLAWRPSPRGADVHELQRILPLLEPTAHRSSELTAIAELVESRVPEPRFAEPRVPEPVVAAVPVATRPPAPVAVPPPPLEQLPVIRFAGGWQPGRKADVERIVPEEDEDGTGSGALRTAWVWVRRTGIAAGLVVGVVMLAKRQETWVPQTRVAAVSLFSGMDELKTRVAPSPSSAPTALVAAVATSSEQLPVLGVETIQLIMASAGHALEPVEVLRRTFAALDRARPALAKPTAAELDALTSGLSAELPAPDGTWLRDYLNRVRERAVTVHYEDTKALWLMSRAARRLPAERLQRLQQVLGAAVAMGLQPRTSAAHAQS